MEPRFRGLMFSFKIIKNRGNLMRGNGHMSRFSFAPASVRTSSQKRAGVRGAVAVLGLMGAALTSPSHAQAPPLLTAGSFGVLAGSTVTNTGSTVINGDVGVS